MYDKPASSRKQPALSEGLVAQAQNSPGNSSATMVALLAGYVANEQQTRLNHQRMADVCADDWNAVHATIGSFADQHSTL